MKIKTEKRDNGVIIKLKGNIIGNPDDTIFNNSIAELIKENTTNIVIDFENVNYVNSSGLGIILRGYHKVKAAGGDIKLANLNEKMRSLIEITKLDKIFDVFETADQALLNTD